MITIRTETIATPLKKGDEFIAASISSPLLNKKEILDGLKLLEQWGLVCRAESLVNIKSKWGYLAGNDAIRFSNLHPKKPTKFIIFTRGGWGAARLLERPQPWRPGWLLGYSDISSILLSRLSDGFDGGIHGPLLTSLKNEPNWSKERLKSLLFGLPLPDIHGESWVKGIAAGPLVVTNLTVATHLLGSRHMPNLKGAILILEDTFEAPYRIDRMLTHWRLEGSLKNISGLAFGNFNQCNDLNSESPQDTFDLEEILKERCFDLGIPIIGKLPIGHCCGNAAMPLGRKAILNGNKGSLRICS